MNYLQTMAAQMGITIWLLVIIAIWSLTWKLIALWKSARNNHLGWFIIMALVNTVGILPILYIFLFAKLDYKNLYKKSEKTKTGKKKPKKKK